MKVAEVRNFRVVSVYNWVTLPPEVVGDNNYKILESFQQEVDIGWKYEGGEFLPPDEIVINYGTKITKLAFLNRLGDSVLAAIEAASRVNNTLGYAAAVIKIKHASSTYIDLSLPETQSDVQKLVDYGFIDAAKRLEILNTPVTEKEVPLFLNGNIY
jgi:hypothetical protein